MAALKSFDRAIALAPGKKSLNYGKALVYHRLREYQLAIEQFELSEQDCTLKNVGLKSKCDCLLDYSNHLFTNGYFARSMDILNQSLVTCLQLHKNNCQTAKVFKLISIIYHTAFLRQSLWSLLDQNTFKEASMALFGLSLTQFSSLLLQTAKLSLEKCFSLTIALGIDPNLSSLWNDLSIINFYSYLETKDPNEHQKSMGYLFHGLRQDSQNPDIWKTMGLINLSTDPKISQHSLIKAVELDSKDALAWAYLGFLYSESNEWELADKAFVQSTIVDAECSLAWLGHALLKEKQGDQEGCIKLLEHIHDLSLGTMVIFLVLIGLGSWECSTTLSIVDQAQTRSLGSRTALKVLICGH
jgi:superkiller protein 3